MTSITLLPGLATEPIQIHRQGARDSRNAQLSGESKAFCGQMMPVFTAISQGNELSYPRVFWFIFKNRGGGWSLRATCRFPTLMRNVTHIFDNLPKMEQMNCSRSMMNLLMKRWHLWRTEVIRLFWITAIMLLKSFELTDPHIPCRSQKMSRDINCSWSIRCCHIVLVW
jgi:hypothetical protein